MVKFERGTSRALSAALGVLCVATAGGYAAAVLGVLTAAPAQPSPDDLQAVGLISEMTHGSSGELYITVQGIEEELDQTLTCTGDPDEDPSACTALHEQDDAFAEVAEGTICTETSYGRETATITGTWDGEDVETALSRKGSCEEARWQRLRFLTEPFA